MPRPAPGRAERAKEAILDTLKRISRNYNHDLARLNRFDIQFYALRRDGAFAGGSLWNGSYRGEGRLRQNTFTVNTGEATRVEPTVHLYERKA